MLRKFAVPALALLALPAIASAQFEAGDYEFTLAGTLSAPKDIDGVSVGARASLGYFLTKEAEIGVRQSVQYLYDRNTPGTDDSAWGGQTSGFIDYHFDFGALQPFVGGVIGYDYPTNTSGSTFAAPEVGVKYFVNGTTFVFGQVAYHYMLDLPKESFFEGLFGVGFRF